MNRTLIKALDSLNNLLALAIVIICTVGGFGYGNVSGSGVVTAILGLVAGILVASIVCGLLAILIEIEKHLRKLAAQSDVKP